MSAPTRCTAIGPNRIALVELETRWDYADPAVRRRHPGDFLDRPVACTSLFGASKVAADVMVQEYGRYFGMPTCCLRGGCLTGPNHSGVELHGFLSYLVRVQSRGARIPDLRLQGQTGPRQHPLPSTSRASSTRSPKRRAAARSTTSAAAKRTPAASSRRSRWLSGVTGKPQRYSYVDDNRIGDHICYYSDLRKMRAHYPRWDI